MQLAAFGVSAAIFAMFLYVTLYMQNFLGLSPYATGVRYLPITVASFLVAPLAGALLSRVQARLMLSIGLAAVGVGMLLWGGIETDSDWTTLLAGFLVGGAGIGLINPVIVDVAVSVVPTERSGMAAGINDTFRQVGIAVGTAVWGAIFIGRGADKVGELTAGTPAADGGQPHRLVEAVSSGNLDEALAPLPPASRAAVASAAREGFLSGLNLVLLLGALVCFVSAAPALWLVREHEIERQAPVPEPTPERVES